MYSADKIKTWESPDGGGFCGDLLRDGQIVGTFRDDGNGAGAYVDAFINVEEETLFRAHIKACPDVVTDMPDHQDSSKFFSYKMNDDTFISSLVGQYIETL